MLTAAAAVSGQTRPPHPPRILRLMVAAPLAGKRGRPSRPHPPRDVGSGGRCRPANAAAPPPPGTYSISAAAATPGRHARPLLLPTHSCTRFSRKKKTRREKNPLHRHAPTRASSHVCGGGKAPTLAPCSARRGPSGPPSAARAQSGFSRQTYAAKRPSEAKVAIQHHGCPRPLLQRRFRRDRPPRHCHRHLSRPPPPTPPAGPPPPPADPPPPAPDAPAGPETRYGLSLPRPLSSEPSLSAAAPPALPPAAGPSLSAASAASAAARAAASTANALSGSPYASPMRPRETYPSRRLTTTMLCKMATALAGRTMRSTEWNSAG